MISLDVTVLVLAVATGLLDAYVLLRLRRAERRLDSFMSWSMHTKEEAMSLEQFLREVE